MPLTLGAGGSRATGKPFQAAVEVALMAMLERSPGTGGFDTNSRRDPTWIGTLHGGLELRGRQPDRVVPSLFIGTGLTYVAIGDLRGQSFGRPPWTLKGAASLRPSLAIGLDLRLPRPDPDRPCMHASLRVIHVPDGHGGLTLVPILLGVAF